MKKVLLFFFTMIGLLALPAQAEEFVQIHVPYLDSGAGCNEIHPDVQRETSGSMSDILIDIAYIDTKYENAYGLGYSIYYYFQNATEYSRWNGLKLLKVDGVEPNDKTIADGTYPLSDYAYLAIRADEPEGSPARRLVDFMLSDAGQECVENAGFGPLDYSERVLRNS